MKRKGFSLIELMIYLSLLLFLMYHCIPWSIATVLDYNARHADAQRMIDCCVLHNFFIKDVFDSSCNKNAWIILSAHQVVWQKNDTTYVGWLCDNNDLYRVTGSFNVTTLQWLKKHTTPVLRNASQLLFQWRCDEDRLYSITLEITINHVCYFFTGAPRYANN